jgi:hypothetical protein
MDGDGGPKFLQILENENAGGHGGNGGYLPDEGQKSPDSPAALRFARFRCAERSCQTALASQDHHRAALDSVAVAAGSGISIAWNPVGVDGCHKK